MGLVPKRAHRDELPDRGAADGMTRCGPSRDELGSEQWGSFRNELIGRGWNELATNTVLARVGWIAMVAA